VVGAKDPAGGAEPVSGLLRGALSLGKIPLYRHASALIFSTAANGVLGLIYWILAARLYTTDEVGRGAAGVAALTLVGMLGCTGITPALIRFVPVSGPGTARLARSAYAASALISLTCGGAFLLATQIFVESLPIHGLFYLAAVLVWVVFTLEDGMLIGLRRTGWVPLENVAFGITKITLLVIFSASDSAWGIFASWSLAAALVIVPVNIALFKKFIPDHVAQRAREPDEFALGEIARFSSGNHLSGLLMVLPDFLMPLIVLQIEGARETAYFYAAWNLVWPLRLIAANIANALTAEAAADERELGGLLRRAGVMAAAVFLPLSLMLVLASHLMLRLLFGGEYASNGEVLVRFLAPGLVPFAFTSLIVAIARVRRELLRLLALAVVSSCVSISLSISLIFWVGIEGAGVAWLASQACLALVALAIWSLHIFDRPAGVRPGQNIVADTVE